MPNEPANETPFVTTLCHSFSTCFKKSWTSARQSADLALIQYREGATDYTTVLTAQQALLSEQDRLAGSRGDVPQGLISVYRALGGGWDIREGRSFIPPEVREEMENRTDWGKLLTPAAVEPWAPDEHKALIRTPDW